MPSADLDLDHQLAGLGGEPGRVLQREIGAHPLPGGLQPGVHRLRLEHGRPLREFGRPAAPRSAAPAPSRLSRSARRPAARTCPRAPHGPACRGPPRGSAVPGACPPRGTGRAADRSCSPTRGTADSARCRRTGSAAGDRFPQQLSFLGHGTTLGHLSDSGRRARVFDGGLASLGTTSLGTAPPRRTLQACPVIRAVSTALQPAPAPREPRWHRGGLRVARIAGIPILLSPTWLISILIIVVFAAPVVTQVVPGVTSGDVAGRRPRAGRAARAVACWPTNSATAWPPGCAASR